jgi:hypothetical protein
VLKYYLEDFCFNIFLEFISVRFSQFDCLWPTRLGRGVRISRRLDPGSFVANRAAIPQRGRKLNVITAHFKPAESSTCFKTILKNKFLLYYHVSYNKLLSIIGMLLWDI